MPWFSKCLNWLCKLEGTSVPATEKPIIWSKLRQNREIKIVALRLCLLGVFHFSFLHKLHNVYQFAISIHTAIRIQGKKWAIYICRQRSELKAYLYTHRQTEKKKKIILYAKQESSSQSTGTSSTGRRGPFSSVEVEEGLSGTHDELLPSICCFPDGTETLRCSQGPRPQHGGDMWGTKSVFVSGPKSGSSFYLF